MTYGQAIRCGITDGSLTHEQGLTMTSDKKTVCVTGASGFVGSQIVVDLLERGYEVRATVRDPSNLEKYGFLKELPGADEGLTLHRGQLLEEGCFDEVMEGCDYCIHTASPYVLDVKDPQADLVEPAVKGTENVLGSAHQAGVKRVIVTSSMAAVTDEPDPDKVLTEDDWNEKSSLKRNPYYFSKAEAERAAWRLAEERDGLDVVVINPYLVIGPSVTPSLNTSNEIFVDLMSGEYPGIISLTWGIVDVRDVSLAHLEAMERDDAEGRFLCVAERMTMEEVVELLNKEGYDEAYSLPSFNLASPIGDFATRIFSYFQPAGTGSYLRTHLGKVPSFDNAKSRDVLGLDYRPVEETILATVKDLEKWGHLEV